MSKIVDFPDNEAVYDQASEWIAAIDRGLSDEEKSELKAWLSGSSHRRQVLFHMADLWDKMDSLSRLAELFDVREPVQERQARRPKFYYAAAASILLVVFAGVFGLSLSNQSAEQQVDGVYETAVGEHSTVNLPDGSQMILNTNSRISVNYSDEHRLFLLERGEVHIDVAHDKTRPLSVMAGDKVVQAVGTAFNVQIFNDQEVELIVTEGKVRVAERENPGPSVEEESAKRLPETALAVSQGEKIILGSKKQAVAKIEDAEMVANLSWRQGNLVFRGETLEEALEEISRYTSVNFEIVDEDIRHERIAGLFKAGDVAGLLTALNQNFNIDNTRLENNTIRLSSANIAQ